MKNQKSLTNKGFSLVELIIVVAIMAILIGVLAPQYLRYVEKSRLQKDNTAMGEIADVLKMTSADEALIKAMDGSITVTFNAAGEMQDPTVGTNGDAAKIKKELTDTLGDLSKVKLSSNTYKGSVVGGYDQVKIEATIDPATNVMTVQCKQWMETVSDTTVSTKVF